MVKSTAPLALAFIGEIETQTGSCTRFQALSQSNRSENMCRLLLRRFARKLEAAGEPRTVPSLFPLRREGQELNKYRSSTTPISSVLPRVFTYCPFSIVPVPFGPIS